MRHALRLALLSLVFCLAISGLNLKSRAEAVAEHSIPPSSLVPAGHDRYTLPVVDEAARDQEYVTLVESVSLSEESSGLTDVVCNDITPAQPLDLPDDGTWVSACFSDPRAPRGAAISEISLKYAVDHPDRNELEIRLARRDSSVVQALCNRGTLTTGTEFGKAPSLSTFKGLSGDGEWVLQVRDVVPGNRGKLTAVSFVPTYIAPGPQPIQKAGSPGRPGIPSLPVPPSGPPSPDRNPQKSNPRKSPNAPTPAPLKSAPAAPQVTSTSWQTVKQETFEGAFPNCGGFPGACWTVNGNPTWNDDDWWPHAGYWAAWPAAGGTNAVDPEFSNYLPNMNSWMFYGPLDLRAATSAQVSFWLWRYIEANYDKFWFAVWDGSQWLGAYSWDGYMGWEEEVVDLAPYVGRTGLYLAWGFVSDSSIQHSGPWVDDIGFIVLPGEVTSRGSLFYANRSNIVPPPLVAAPSSNIYLCDWNASSGTSRCLASTFTRSDGSFSFPPVMNWDTDPADPDPRLDLYVVWESDTSKDTEPRRAVLDTITDQVYQWTSGVHSNVPNGVGGSADFYNTNMSDGYPNLRAMWLLQDMNRGREYVLSHTNPVRDPGGSRAYWTQDVNAYDYCQDGSCFVGGTNPYIFLRDGQMRSEDTPLHELGHHYMHTATNGWWYPWPDCYGHWYFTAKNTGCGWSEGWADFFALAVNNNSCYDFDTVTNAPCSGTANTDYFNMETHDRTDNCTTWACGDAVEGRVAGALWDFYDSANDGNDVVNHGFAPVWSRMARQPGLDNFRQYWDGWTIDRHNSVRAIYQNTIDYDIAPYWSPQPLAVLRNGSLTFDLWPYVWDTDSQDSQLGFPSFTNLNPQCAVGLPQPGHMLTFTPNVGYTGTCSARVDAFDGLKTSVGTFSATVVWQRALMPHILK